MTPHLPDRSRSSLRDVPFLLALLAGVVLRVVVMVAYRPALLFPDSFSYLERAHHFTFLRSRPGGYSLFLWPILHLTDSLTAVALVQHLLGLLLAVLCYAFLMRRGLPWWGATLAVLPLLLDPLQLVLEQYALTDVLFETLLVTACLAMLWRHRPRLGEVLLAGMLVGCAGTVRGAGTFVLAVFLVAAVCLRLHWTKVVALGLAGLAPMAVYATFMHQEFGSFAVSTSGPRFLYARLAPIVHCDGVRLPPHLRPLCPSEPVGDRPDANYYMWGGHRSAQWHIGPANDRAAELRIVKDFDRRMVRAQPLVYGRAVLADFARGFAPSRTSDVPGYPASYWLFDDHYWSLDTFSAYTQHRADRYGVTSDPAAAAALTAYQHRVRLPGPLAAALLALAALAVAGVGRARRCGDRVAIYLLSAACVVPLLTGAALSGFSWRYQLPQIPLLPLAGALGLAALLRGRAPGRPAEPASPGLLARAEARTRVPAVVLALLVAVATGLLAAAVVVESGWVAPLWAGAGGGVLAVAVLVVLLVSWARSRAAGRPAAT